MKLDNISILVAIAIAIQQLQCSSQQMANIEKRIRAGDRFTSIIKPCLILTSFHLEKLD
jgi:hypothetical protein